MDLRRLHAVTGLCSVEGWAAPSKDLKYHLDVLSFSNADLQHLQPIERIINGIRDEERLAPK